MAKIAAKLQFKVHFFLCPSKHPPAASAPCLGHPSPASKPSQSCSNRHQNLIYTLAADLLCPTWCPMLPLSLEYFRNPPREPRCATTVGVCGAPNTCQRRQLLSRRRHRGSSDGSNYIGELDVRRLLGERDHLVQRAVNLGTISPFSESPSSESPAEPASLLGGLARTRRPSSTLTQS